MLTLELRQRHLNDSLSEKESNTAVQKKYSGNSKNLESWLNNALKVSSEFNYNGSLSGKEGRYSL
jgi:hypothetical protein